MRRVLTLLPLVVALAGCGGEPKPKQAADGGFDCIVGVNVGADDPAPSAEELRRQCDEQRRERGAPSTDPLPRIAGAGPEVVAGRRIAARSGCLACHRIGSAGNDGPGPQLTDIGDRLPDTAIRRSLVEPVAPMPSFRALGDRDLDRLVAYLGALR